MLAVDVKTNPLSIIRENDLYAVGEGQVFIIGVIVIETGGELRLEDNSDLILE